MPPPRRQTYVERAAAIALVNTLDNADCRRRRRLPHDLHMSMASGARASLDRRHARASIHVNRLASGVAGSSAMTKVVLSPKCRQ